MNASLSGRLLEPLPPAAVCDASLQSTAMLLVHTLSLNGPSPTFMLRSPLLLTNSVSRTMPVCQAQLRTAAYLNCLPMLLT